MSVLATAFAFVLFGQAGTAQAWTGASFTYSVGPIVVKADTKLFTVTHGPDKPKIAVDITCTEGFGEVYAVTLYYYQPFGSPAQGSHTLTCTRGLTYYRFFTQPATGKYFIRFSKAQNYNNIRLRGSVSYPTP